MNFTFKNAATKKGIKAVRPDPVDSTCVGFSLQNILNTGAT
jgi:hypothetical protein